MFAEFAVRESAASTAAPEIAREYDQNFVTLPSSRHTACPPAEHPSNLAESVDQLLGPQDKLPNAAATQEQSVASQGELKESLQFERDLVEKLQLYGRRKLVGLACLIANCNCEEPTAKQQFEHFLPQHTNDRQPSTHHLAAPAKPLRFHN